MRRFNYFKAVMGILLVSLSMNIYLSINKHMYKEKALKNTYHDMRNIKEKSKITEEMLTKILEMNSYTGVEILSIYDNFSVMAIDMVNLWDDYSFFEDKPVVSKKKIDLNNVLNNDVFFRVEEYLKNVLTNVMGQNKKSYTLTEKEKKDLGKINSFLKEINLMFKEYDENELKGFENELREKEVMKKEYWVDMLDKINEINAKYSDYDFSNKIKLENNI